MDITYLVLKFNRKEGDNMVKMANLTLHEQSEYVEGFRKYGFEIEVSPQGLLVENNDSKAIRDMCKEKIDEIVSQGYQAVLLGGRTDVAIYLYQFAKEKGLKCYIVHTERIRKVINDKSFFEFKFEGLTEVI